MPSASAKLEKFASQEAADPIKQVILIIDKKVRNLEKRKGKLDNYRTDYQNGKELNEDQKNAMKKYEHVVDVVEFAKEFQKSVNSTIQDCLKLQKKFAKREQAEKQQQEIYKVQEILLYKDLVDSLADETIRQDFCDGTGGAVQLTEEELCLLDELRKVLSPKRSSKDKDFKEQLTSAAEHLVGLVENKKKEINGVSYQSIKELLLKINGCEYFSSTSQNILPQNIEVDNGSVEVEEEIEDESRTMEEVEAKNETICIEEPQEVVSNNVHEGSSPENTKTEELNQHDSSIEVNSESENQVEQQQPDPPSQQKDVSAESAHQSNIVSEATQIPIPKHPLQDVLPLQGHFSFLQESQIDMESPHMDPAVVVAHPMVPAPSSNHQSTQYSHQVSTHQEVSQNGLPAKTEENSILSDAITDAAPHEELAPIPPGGVTTITQPILTHSPQDFDPSQPIPTQTFTNQNFAVMQNMIATSVVPPAYIPVTMHHGPIPTHVTPVAIVPQHISPRGTPPPTTGGMPIHLAAVPVTAAAIPASLSSQEAKDHYISSEYQASLPNGDAAHPEAEIPHHSLNMEQSQRQTDDSQGNFSCQQNNYNQSRNNYVNGRGNRSRGRNSTGYNRGRGYSNGRGSYQGSAYQGAGYYHQGYSGGSMQYNNNNNYRRGGPRGAPRGSGNGRGGRGGYRPQQTVQQQA